MKIPICNSEFFISKNLKEIPNIKELRKIVLQWLKYQNTINVRFKFVFNKSFGNNIYFTWQGLKNNASESSENYTEKLLSFSVLPEIVEMAKYKGNVSDKLKRPDIVKIHYFESEVIVNYISYVVNICVYEVKMKKTENIFVYAHTLSIK